MYDDDRCCCCDCPSILDQIFGPPGPPMTAKDWAWGVVLVLGYVGFIIGLIYLLPLL